MFNSRIAKMEWNNSVFNIPESNRLYNSVPPLMIGFDTETTGLKNNPEPISYGFGIYRNGKLHRTEHFLAQPLKENAIRNGTGGGVSRPSEPGAVDTHGWSDNAIRLSANGDMKPLDDNYPANEMVHPEEFSKMKMADVSKRYYPPATHPRVAINRAVSLLAHYMKQGAVLVGANPTYDLNSFFNTYKKYNNADISTSGLNLGYYKYGDHKILRVKAPVIDVISHDIALDPHEVLKGEPGYRSRSLTNLAKHYGVDPGGHKALDDACATVEVFKKQVDAVRRKAGIQ